MNTFNPLGAILASKNTFIVADDHPLFREALIHAIGNCVDDATIIEADSLDTLQAVVEAHPEADLLLLDLNMPGVSGFSALAYIRSNHEALPTVIVSAMDDPAVIRRSIQHGASGFIPNRRLSARWRPVFERCSMVKYGYPMALIFRMTDWIAKKPGSPQP